MTDLVKDEINKIQAREVSSDFERNIREDIFNWSAKKYGKYAAYMHFGYLCEMFWADYFEDAVVN
jgi:hypothetical protein